MSFSCRKNKPAIQSESKIDTLALIKGIAGIHRWKGRTQNIGGMYGPPYPTIRKDTFESEIVIFSDTEIFMTRTMTDDHVLKLTSFDIKDSIVIFTAYVKNAYYPTYTSDTISYHFGQKTLRYGAYYGSKYGYLGLEYYSPEIPFGPPTCLGAMANEQYKWAGYTYHVFKDASGQMQYTDTTSYSFSFQLLVFSESKVSSGEYYSSSIASLPVDTMYLIWSNDSLSGFTGRMFVEHSTVDDSIVINCHLKTMYWHQLRMDTSSGYGVERVVHYP